MSGAYAGTPDDGTPSENLSTTVSSESSPQQANESSEEAPLDPSETAEKVADEGESIPSEPAVAVSSEGAGFRSAGTATPPSTQPRNPEALVNWEADFPDPTFRAVVQKAVNRSGRKDINTTKYKHIANLIGIRSSDIADKKALSDTRGIELLTSLREADFRETSITSLDISKNPSLVRVRLQGSAMCPAVDIVHAGLPQQYDPEECGTSFHTVGDVRMPSWGTYVINGTKRYFSWDHGESPLFNITPDSRDERRPLKWEKIPSGIKFSHLVGGKFQRDEVRTVDNHGTIHSKVTVTNITDKTLGTHLIEWSRGSIRAQALGGNAHIRTDGNVTFYTTFYGDLPAGKVYVASAHNTASSSHTGDGMREQITRESAKPLDELKEGTPVEGNTIMLLDPRAMAPGNSLSYSYSVGLQRIKTVASVRIDYISVNSSGAETVLASTSNEGAPGSVWDFSTYPELPVGYELDPQRPSPTGIAYGKDGALTIVKVYIRKKGASSPGDTPNPGTTPPANPGTTPPANPGTTPGTTPPANPGTTPPATHTQQPDTTITVKPKERTHSRSTEMKTSSKELAKTGFDGSLIILATVLTASGAGLMYRRRK
ncbi:LPXTG cell wall anchor domain-containing protein [Schaalia canis]|uniref:LPXTG cell wall anchor domain-containing protein n=1 Tax=Schaalia canis TaxID=100469 RepID=UPI00196AB42A|nr:LPXTG cell wall anchor domain-containing protein [Schaalia canis]